MKSSKPILKPLQKQLCVIPGWDSMLKKPKQELGSTVSGHIVLTNHSKNFSANLQERANQKDQVDLGTTDETEVKPFVANYSSCPEI